MKIIKSKRIETSNSSLNYKFSQFLERFSPPLSISSE